MKWQIVKTEKFLEDAWLQDSETSVGLRYLSY